MGDNKSEKYKNREVDWAGRIPSCLERYPLGNAMIHELINLHEDGFNFNSHTIAKRGWVAIDAPYNGGELFDEKKLIVDYANSIGINTLYATSKDELDRAENGCVLLARIPQFSEEDILALQLGWWCVGDWIHKLQAKKLMWDSWRESILFTIPLRFSVIRLIDGYGHTTIAGEPELIEMIKTRSFRLPEPGDLSDYDWYGRLLPETLLNHVRHLREKNCLYEWFDWPDKQNNSTPDLKP